MPKIKVKRSSTVVDMTAMTDVSFLLLTFFILTAKFRPAQPVVIDMPSSESQLIVPDNLMVISVDKEGIIYYSIENPTIRVETLKNLIERYGAQYPSLATLNEKQIANFANVEMMGFPIADLPNILNKPAGEVSAMREFQGVPLDSANAKNNELRDWIQAGRWADRIYKEKTGAESADIRVAIKGDKNSNIKKIQEVIKTLTGDPVNIQTFNLITTLEGPLAAGVPAEAPPK